MIDEVKGKLIVASSSWMNEKAPDQRLDFISMLRVLSKFCWNCGYDFDDHRRKCHCDNDE